MNLLWWDRCGSHLTGAGATGNLYVSRQGYNPLTQPLRWADLEQVAQTGVIPPGEGTRTNDPALSGVSNSINVSAPGRTGRHVVFTVWQASHMDQSYYWCSDVVFPGGSGPTPPRGCTAGYTVTATNVAYNGGLGAGASTNFGFLGSWTGSNGSPTPTCAAT